MTTYTVKHIDLSQDVEIVETACGIHKTTRMAQRDAEIAAKAGSILEYNLFDYIEDFNKEVNCIYCLQWYASRITR